MYIVYYIDYEFSHGVLVLKPITKLSVLID